MPRDYTYFVHIMASKRNGTLYVGMTNDIFYRARQHAEGKGGAFSKKYDIKMLVWFEQHQYVDQAIAREKIVKKYGRKKKLALIEKDNPTWRDLADRTQR